MFEVTTDGTLVRVIDINAAHAKALADLAFAPGSANASAKNLYLVDRRVDNNNDPLENDGKIFEMALPPMINSFTPTSGPVGTAVTITGYSFIGATALAFNGTGAAFTVLSNTQINTTVPAGATTGKISVTNAVGTNSSAADFGLPPTITSFTPISGQVGTAVTITGSNFTGATAVAFSGTAATFTVNSNTQISTSVPAGATTGKIRVTAPAGLVDSNSNFIVIAQPPAIASFTPASGPAGAAVTITGSSFSGATAVTFSGTAATFTVGSDSQISATVPAGATTGKISVTNAAGTAFSVSDFTVTSPIITGFTPISGPVGTVVTVTGANFTGAIAVTFNGTAGAFTVDSDTQITTSVPAGAATGQISIANAVGAGVSENIFTVNLLLNSGFELDANSDGKPDTWTTNGRFTRSAEVVLSGSYAGKHYATDNSSYNILQTVNALTAGTTYQFSGWVNIPPTSDVFSFKLDLQWLNSGGAIISTTIIKNYTTSTNGWDPATTSLAAPAGTTSAKVRMVVGSLNATIYVDQFLFNNFGVPPPSPTVTSFTPTSGPVGSSVSINGTGFTGASAVRFNGTAATTYVFNNDTLITATVPTGAASGTISVTTPGGTGTSANSFTVVSAAMITSISPNSGPPAGGQSVNIAGTDLGGASSVTFGGTAGTITANTATQITVTAPAHAAGVVDVVVTTPGGSTTSTGGYTFQAGPAITGISPNSGPTAGGQSVNINGADLSGATSVTFGGAAAAITANTATQITVTTPTHAAGAVDVVVTTPGGSTTSTGGYTFQAGPAITGISPNSGPTVGGQSVNINGSDLNGATAVTFGGAAATITANTATQITVTTPAHAAGVVDVVVTTPGGSTTSTGGYTFQAGPAITGISPNSGPTAGGQSVNINGADLSGATSVTFGGAAAAITANTATQITVTTPTHAAGAVDVVVTTLGGNASSTGGYTYQALPPPAPVVTSFMPISGPVGTTVTITGSNFTGSTVVAFNGTAATNFTVDLDTQITVTVPSGATSGKVSVTNSGGTGQSATDFVVTAAPTISSFTPTGGPVGTAVTITGTNFTGATAVAFNGTGASAFTIDSDIQITATVPAGATSGKISVTNGVGSGLSSTNFTVNLLLNGGFELDANSDGKPDGWSTSNKFTRSSEVVLSGSYAGKHFATDNSGYNIIQTVNSLTAGATYQFSGWLNILATSDVFTFKLQVIWKDASDITISTKIIKTYTTGTSSWNQAVAALVAPAGTTNARIQMLVSSLNATIYVDDFVFFRP